MKKISGDKVKELAAIDEQFFGIDKERDVAKFELLFDSPQDIFDENTITRKPVLNDDFMDLISSAFTLISSKYKIDLTVKFRDMGEYSEEELSGIFLDNIELQFRSKLAEHRQENRIGRGLIGIGVGCLLLMLLIENLWEGDSLWKDVFVYVSDIATTVTIWEAMTIFLVERREKRSYLIKLASRFSTIRFTQA